MWKRAVRDPPSVQLPCGVTRLGMRRKKKQPVFIKELPVSSRHCVIESELTLNCGLCTECLSALPSHTPLITHPAVSPLTASSLHTRQAGGNRLWNKIQIPVCKKCQEKKTPHGPNLTVIPEGRGKRKTGKVPIPQLYHGLKWKKPTFNRPKPDGYTRGVCGKMTVMNWILNSQTPVWRATRDWSDVLCVKCVQRGVRLVTMTYSCFPFHSGISAIGVCVSGQQRYGSSSTRDPNRDLVAAVSDFRLLSERSVEHD